MTKELNLSLFQNLLYIRAVEEKICELYPEQQIRCPVHLCIGQEAVAVGVCKNLTNGDIIFSNHRSHGHYLAKGGNLNKFFAEMYGKETGCSKGRGGSMHLIDTERNFIGSTPIVGGTIPLAVGAAFALKYNNSEKIAVVFFGDGATEEGVFHESLNFAKLKSLPILFICENNFYSVYTSLNDRQPKRKISDITKAHGLISYNVDGNDVLAVYNISKKAIEELRGGKGPVFVEAATYRWREHCGPNYDNHIGYRTEEEFLDWKAKDPLKILKEELIKERMITEEEIIKLKNEIDSRIEEAIRFAKAGPFPEKEELNKYVYMD